MSKEDGNFFLKSNEMHTIETKQKIREKINQKYLDSEYVNRKNIMLRDAMKRPEVRKIHSLRMMGELNPAKRLEVRDKIRNSIIYKYRTDLTYRKRVSDMTKLAMSRKEVREKYLLARSKCIKNKNTSIEIAIENELLKRNILYEKQKPILGIAIPDFFLTFFNICIFCDGDYWHNRVGVQDKDELKNKKLIENGYQVVRFWEHDIKRSPENCVNELVKYVL